MSSWPHSLSVAKSDLFTDDTKCMHTIKDLSVYITLQNDTDNLSNSWQLKFKVSKCTHPQYLLST